MENKYLSSEEDGLEMRPSGKYAKEKLDILKRFLYMFTTSMRKKSWTALNYIDLEAGPGKNRLRETNEIVLGSPLLALTTEHPFDNYFFVEKKGENFESLQIRANESPLAGRIKMYHGDCNMEINNIVRDIKLIDSRSKADSWGSLNLVFIDPQGLEVNWETIEVLARQTRSDLIINFSTSGITRNIKEQSQSSNETKIDRFFGTREWRQIYEQLPNRLNYTEVRRKMLDFYSKRLSELSYLTTLPNGEYIVLNSKNRQLYSLICASKNPLGVDFFAEAAAKFKQAGLPGFDVD